MFDDLDWPLNASRGLSAFLVIQKLIAVFATKSLLELGGDDRDNLRFMNFNTDSFKFVKIREF